MRHWFLLVCFVVISGFLCAQESDLFLSVKEVHNKRAFLTRPDDSVCRMIYSEGYVLVDGKYRPLRKIKHPSSMIAFDREYVVRTTFKYKQSVFVRLASGKYVFCVPVERGEYLLPYLHSKAYWNSRYEHWSACRMLDVDKCGGMFSYDASRLQSGTYVPVEWSRYEWDKTENASILVYFRVQGGALQHLSNKQIDTLFQRGAMQMPDSAVRQPAPVQESPEIVEAVPVKEEITPPAPKMRREKSETRQKTSDLSDDDLFEWANQMTGAQKKYQSREICLLRKSLIHQNGSCGISFQFFNCFPKKVDYIELTLTAYNGSRQIQTDDSGVSEQVVRCNGIITLSEFVSYRVPVIFQDKSRRISDLRINQIRIVFTDRSSKTYAGYENVKKHCE